MAGPDTLEFTDDTFDQDVLKADTPVLVDFWAEWCGPCHLVAPIVDELAEEYAGRVKFVKIDTEENFDTPARYGVLSLPTLRLFKDGQRVEQMLGFRGKSDLRRLLDKALN